MNQTTNHQNYLLHLGKKFSAARHLKGEKITTVAKAMGVSHSVISLIENGRYYCLKVKMILELAEYLHVPQDSLLSIAHDNAT